MNMTIANDNKVCQRIISLAAGAVHEPVKLGFDELLNHLLEGTDFAPYNTRVTFDENGKLVEFLYNYSPWN